MAANISFTWKNNCDFVLRKHWDWRSNCSLHHAQCESMRLQFSDLASPRCRHRLDIPICYLDIQSEVKDTHLHSARHREHVQFWWTQSHSFASKFMSNTAWWARHGLSDCWCGRWHDLNHLDHQWKAVRIWRSKKTTEVSGKVLLEQQCQLLSHLIQVMAVKLESESLKIPSKVSN